jgi:predicted HTH domain antitoxin
MLKAVFMPLIISDDILNQANLSADDLRIELAAWLYRQRRMSFGQAKTLAGLTHLAFQAALADRGIAQHYDVEDLHTDLRNLGLME